MKIDIVLGGVGGQGILSIAAIIGTAAVNMGMSMKQSEVHGMSQRGGDVMSNLRISSGEIYSDLIQIGGADLIIGVEPLEALRHIHMLSKDGWLVTNTKPLVNIPNYPDINVVYKEIEKIHNHVLIDADAMAKDLGNIKMMNVIMLGAALPFLKLSKDDIVKAINMIFGKKGDDIVAKNIEALEAGIRFSENISR